MGGKNQGVRAFLRCHGAGEQALGDGACGVRGREYMDFDPEEQEQREGPAPCVCSGRGDMARVRVWVPGVRSLSSMLFGLLGSIPHPPGVS